MWTVNLLLVLFIVSIPLFWLLNWRVGRNLEGMRLENHRLQAQRFLRISGPIWAVMILLLGQQVVDLYPGSRDHRAFWLGFIMASELFAMAFAINNVIYFLGQERDKREKAQAQRNAST